MTAHEAGRGFAPDLLALDARRALARRLVGERIVRVEYVNIDYFGWDLGHQDQDARREITEPAEWLQRTWDAATFHHADFGVELTTARGDVWGITWDPPGPHGESVALRPGIVSERGAVWDVTQREPWLSSIRSTISDITLWYHPWSDDFGGYWCSRVSLSFDARPVEVLLGDRHSDGSLMPSADNIAVITPPAGLPEWERTNDLA